MRKIKVEEWETVLPDGTKGKENLLTALTVLIAAKKPDDIPRGFDQFRMFSRISKAFDKAGENGGVLVLEEADYAFLKKTVEKDVPSTWGLNPNIFRAIESFMNATQEE